MRTRIPWIHKPIAGCLALMLAFPLVEAAPLSAQQQPSQQQSNEAAPAQQSAGPAQNSNTTPVGTAAAPMGKTSGVAASRPSGAVIAPAKQRRARAILIRISVVAAAAIAVGTVVALSHGSPSRPN